MPTESDDVTLVAVAPGEAALVNLLLHHDDFSEIEPVDVAPDGRFHQLDDVPRQHAYLVHAGAQLAGFALVSRQSSHAVEGDTVWSMWEITQTSSNRVALSLWRQALARYAFEEMSYEDPRGSRRSLQRFAR